MMSLIYVSGFIFVANVSLPRSGSGSAKTNKTSDRRIAIKHNINHLLSLEYMIILVFAQADGRVYEPLRDSKRFVV